MIAATPTILTMPWVPTPSDGVPTATYLAQAEAETLISDILSTVGPSESPSLHKSAHIEYLTRLLTSALPAQFTALDASRPWLIYWTVHALSLIGVELDSDGKKRIVDTLRACQNPDGGFGGGPGQISHLAPSYAAVCALAYTGSEGFGIIDRRGMYNFLLSVKQTDGSFVMHKGGDLDVRGCYCALTIATLLNLLTPTLSHLTASHISSCQTFEGGLASSSHPLSASVNPPLGEAHGGYAFCALASWTMLRCFSSVDSPTFVPEVKEKRTPELDLKALLRWSVWMQAAPIEGGGFRGRTNKLVDGCYSWWVGGMFGLLGGLMAEEKGGEEEVDTKELWDRTALQSYVLLVAQSPGGGLRDKPGKYPDAYHTCYNLSGFSSAMHDLVYSVSKVEELRKGFRSPFVKGSEAVDGLEMILDETRGEGEQQAEKRMKEVYARAVAWVQRGEMLILGGEENEVMPTHPVFNIVLPKAIEMLDYFYRQSAVIVVQ